MADDLPSLTYGGKMLRPERDNYSYTEPYGITKSNIAGSLSRLGRSSYGDPANVSCSYTLNTPMMLQWWSDFYEITISQGSKRFRADLLVNGVIQPHVCQIVGSPRVQTIGWTGSVQLQLEVVPIVDRCAAMSRQAVYACYGDRASVVVNEIINVGLLLNKAW